MWKNLIQLFNLMPKKNENLENKKKTSVFSKGEYFCFIKNNIKIKLFDSLSTFLLFTEHNN